jgi:predicted nucleotidyltransferase
LPASKPIAPLLGAVGALESWLRSEKLEHVYIGGLAVALIGRPRITQDIDAIVLLGAVSIPEFLRRSKEVGFSSRVPDAAAFAEKSRVLLLRHDETRVPIDLSIGFLPFEEEVVRRARTMRAKGLEIPVATPEDLLILKAIAGRPRDIVDIEGLIASNPRFDRKRVHSVTALFAELLEDPEIVENLDRLIEASRRRAAPRKKKPSK